MSLLEVSALSRSFGGLRAVDGVGFAAERDRITAVIGPNGAGKTTLFNLIAGSLAPDSGTVAFDGADITGLKPYKIARRGISRTFQSIKLSKQMTALENVMLGRHARSRAGFASGMIAAPWTPRAEERSIREEAMKAIELLGIADYQRQGDGGLYPSASSGRSSSRVPSPPSPSSCCSTSPPLASTSARPAPSPSSFR